MRNRRMFGMIAFTIILLSMLSLPQGFAKMSSGSPVNRPYNRAVIESVSDPSGGCVDVSFLPNTFTYTDYYGLVTITSVYQTVRLQNAHPNSVYSVSIGYLNGNGCDGTWQSLGSISTDQAGNGYVVQHLNLKSHQYQVQFKDSNGNVVYATSILSL